MSGEHGGSLWLSELHSSHPRHGVHLLLTITGGIFSWNADTEDSKRVFFSRTSPFQEKYNDFLFTHIPADFLVAL